MKRTIKKEVQKSGGIGVIQLSTYTSPKVEEVRGQDWIAYGGNNNYFQYLIDRYNGSPTNNAAINGITQMILGKGLSATDSVLKPNEFAQAMLLFDDDTTERLCNDLYSMGQCAIQVVYSVDRTKILECNHFPIETLRSGKCNEDGEVEFYYYSDDWSKVGYRKKPTPIPAFGTSKESEEILYIKPYKTGFYYYSPVSFQGCLQYAELEEEISNFHLNNILNGMSPSMLINFNNGRPTEDEQRDIERNIQNKFSGTSNAGRFILSFNDDSTNGATITPVQLSEAHLQYEFLSNESMRKIMVSHRIISPMLLGIKDQSGFGNNADELQTATVLMDNTVIRPFQTLLIKNFNKILAYNNISLELYFKTLQPLEFSDLSNATSSAVIEQETGQKLSKEIDLSEFGEEIDLNIYELVSSEAVDYEKEASLDLEIEKLNATYLASASTGTARPKSASEQDSPLYITRYRYGGNPTPEREFCKKMMSANKLYRKEDIVGSNYPSSLGGMSALTVNPGFGMNPTPDKPYDVFLWKGGGLLSEEFPNGTCKHFWMREMYRKIGSGRNTAAQPSTPAEVRKAGEIAPTNDKRAYIAPHDM
jgi:hypothetical protein